MKDDDNAIDLNFHTTEDSRQPKSSKKSSTYEKLNERFDDVVSRIDAFQRSEASMRQMLNLLVSQMKDLKLQVKHIK